MQNSNMCDIIEDRDMDALKCELCRKLDQLPEDAQADVIRQLKKENLLC